MHCKNAHAQAGPRKGGAAPEMTWWDTDEHKVSVTSFSTFTVRVINRGLSPNAPTVY